MIGFVNEKTKNKSATYLLPLMSDSVDIKFTYFIINCYIKFNKSVNCRYPFGILYEDVDTREFYDYCAYLIPICKEYHITEEGKLFIFEFPENFINDYISFKAGEYSHLSTDAKSKILIFNAKKYKYPPLVEEIAGVLYKRKERRAKLEKLLNVSIPEDVELGSKIIYEDETYKFISTS